MDKTFDYQGWTFRTDSDGSLTIEPKGVKQGEVDAFTGMKPITIPQEQVYRLIGYSLTGDPQNTEILNSVKQLRQQHTLVGSTNQ